MQLATTLWPRTGGDARNSACISVEGPRRGRVLWSLPLPSLSTDTYHSGAILAADGHLRVVHQGTLSAVNLSGHKLWTRSLKLRRRSLGVNSVPLALADGRVMFTANRRLAEELDGRLRILGRGIRPDDSGPSPNVIGSDIFLGGPEAMLRWDGTTVAEVGPFRGYDILPPARFSNGDLGMACYYDDGLCRVDRDGQTVWTRPPRETHGLVVVSAADEVAAAAERCTVVMDGCGNELWRYPDRARFSCHPDGGWVALAEGHLARLDRAGSIVWKVPADFNVRHPGWGLMQAVVDAGGRTYVPCHRGVKAWNAEGQPLFRTSLYSGSVAGLCPTAPGRMALVHGGHLLMVD